MKLVTGPMWKRRAVILLPILLSGGCELPIELPVEPPTVPQTVSATPGLASMTIAWDPVATSTSYNIYWGTGTGVTKASEKIGDAQFPYMHSNLSGGVAHYYAVTAENSGGESGLSPEVWGFPTLTPQDAALDGVIHIPSELTTIQEGLDAAAPGQTVLVADGIYEENLIWPDVDAITLTSQNGPAATTIDGGDANSVITIFKSNGQTVTPATVISGFKITNGNAVHDLGGSGYSGGGGIYAYNASPTIRNNNITNNRSSQGGGGISAGTGASPVIDGNWIMDNYAAGNGGGIYCRNDSPSTITENQIRNNRSGYCGGGIFTSPTSDPVVFTGNSVSSNSDSAACPRSDCNDTCFYDLAASGGDGGGTGGGGSNSSCDQCLSGCQGTAGCCTGYGCICYEQCTLSAPCATGTSMCCSSYGDCFCMADCPF